MSLIKGGKNPENAKKWYDWALSAEAQNLAVQGKSYQVPSNRNAKLPRPLGEGSRQRAEIGPPTPASRPPA
jgi:ABC-type Fe3+ transport system substrate-binding protein